MLKKIILLFLVIMGTLSCERVFDSPFDPESSNYQEFIVETSSLDFGTNSLYSGSSKNVKLYNTTNNKIIVSINSSSINFKGDTSLTISADSYVDLKLYFMPTEAKTYTGTITADAGNLGKKTISLAGVGKTTTSNEGLVAYYSFDGNANDQSGNGNNGTVHGATYTSSGKTNGAYSFDGSNDYIDVGAVDIQSATKWSVSGWFNLKTTSSFRNGVRFENKFILGYVYNDDLRFYWRDVSNNFRYFSVGSYSSLVGVNNWVFLTMTFDGNYIKAYINGVLTKTYSSTSSYTGSKSVQYIGKDFSSYYWYGSIDEVSIYNKALSQTEITSLYNNGGVPTTSSNIFTVSNTAFGYTPKSKSSTQNITIKNNTNFPISITSITYLSCFTGASSINVGASDSTSLAVTFAPTETNKSYNGTLKLITDIGVTYNVALSGNSSRYQIIEQSKTWSDAKIYCENLGGHLITITSADEMTTISNLIGSSHPNYWIGATDETVEGTWTWVTGEAWSYTNWYSGEPNNSSGNEDQACIQSNRTDWNDGRGSSSLYFICEYESLAVSNLAFGYTPKGKTSTQDLTIKNNTKFPISITSIEYPDCFSGVSAINVPASDSATLAVSFTPIETDKNYSDTLKLVTDIGITYDVVLLPCINGGTVTHETTGLMWKVASEGQTWAKGEVSGSCQKFTWSGTFARAKAVNSGETGQNHGYSDWRVPTFDELRSIVDKDYTPTINPIIFPNTASSCYWSATGSSNRAWKIYFNNGSENYYNDNNLHYLRLVRSGQ